MKPKTKNQKRVYDLNFRVIKDFKNEHGNVYDKQIDKIKPIGKRMSKWAESIFQNYAFRYKSGLINCLKCGHSWKTGLKQAWLDETSGDNCPSCKSQLKIKSTNNRVAEDYEYFTYVTTIKEYQLIRVFKIHADYRTKHPAKYSVSECFRIFINDKGKREVVSSGRTGAYYDTQHWGFIGLGCIKHHNQIDNRYSEQGAIYPKWNLQDYVIKKGFNAYSYENSIYTVSKFISSLLTESKTETLVKEFWTEAIDASIRDIEKIKKYWHVFKICIRKNYRPDNLQNYFDMLNALDYFEKDTHNAYYVCPKYFKNSHDYWIDKKRKHIDKKLKEERLQIYLENSNQYHLKMIKFKDLEFNFGKLKIIPFLELQEVKEAGEKMHHCIFKTESYWFNENNLLLGSYYNGKLVETTAYYLDEQRVYHSYGLQNKKSKHHAKIIKIINTGKHKINECLKPKRKAKTKVKPQKQVA